MSYGYRPRQVPVRRTFFLLSIVVVTSFGSFVLGFSAAILWLAQTLL